MQYLEVFSSSSCSLGGYTRTTAFPSNILQDLKITSFSCSPVNTLVPAITASPSPRQARSCLHGHRHGSLLGSISLCSWPVLGHPSHEQVPLITGEGHWALKNTHLISERIPLHIEHKNP